MLFRSDLLAFGQDKKRERLEKLEETMDSIRAKYGKSSIYLVIDGTITVDGSSGSKGTNAAIRIAEGTTTIKDGYFTVGTDASGIANSCILVATARPSQKAHLKIYGGVFETKGNPINGWYPVINIQDADRKAGRATVEIYGGIFINYNPATGDNTGEADDTFVAPGYKSVETTYNGQQAWQVIPE